MVPQNNHNMEEIVKNLLTQLGEDPSREGLLRTPTRVSKSLKDLTSGYTQSLDKIVNGALFEEAGSGSEMVIIEGIELYSLCEHHMLPFYGKCHVGYLPNKKIIGLSKIPRIVDMFSRRLQVQERLSSQVADTLMEVLSPLGVGVVIEASHLCMMMRGVSKQNSVTKTSALRGEFLKRDTRSEFFNLLR